MDPTQPGDLLRIGTFSHVGRVSARLLRHYHAIGLLSPAVIDDNGYRLYNVSQLTDLHRILALRDLGLSLEQVRDVVDKGLPTHELRQMLLDLEAKTEDERDRMDARLRSIRARVHALDEVGSTEALEIRNVEASPFRSVTGTYSPAEARQVVQSLFDHGTSLGLETPFLTARWTGPYESDEWNLEIGLTGPASEGEPIELVDSTLPAGSFVSSVRSMAADEAHQLYSAIPNYCLAHNLRLDGRLREVVHAMPDPESGSDPIVEVQFGVVSAQ